MMSKQKMILNLPDKLQIKYRILFLFTLFTYSACQPQEKKVENNTSPINEKKTMENILEKQLKQGASQYALDDEGNSVTDVVKHTFNEEELAVCITVVSDILESNGYKVPTNDNYNNKVNEVFRRLIDFNSSKKYLYINCFDICDRELNFHPNDMVNFYGTYVIKNRNFITDFYYLPELIDYQKKFPRIAQKEKSYSDKWYDDQLKMDLGIEKWMELENRKDEYNLRQIRFKNEQLLIHRNKYLFNDNKASFAWLQFNDKFFLESLVKTFGYVKDENLLNFVLKNNYKNQDEFYKILWNERCNGNIVVNKEVFDLMQKSPIEKQKEYLARVSEYLQNAMNYPPDAFAENFSKKAEILGKIAYYGEKMGAKIDMSYQCFKNIGMSGMWENPDASKFEEEFKKQNYYNIPDFKEVWEETKTGGVSYPGME